MNQSGYHCGYDKLAETVRRARPILHCFGHIHEGRGVLKTKWDGEELSKFQAVDDVGSDLVRVKRYESAEATFLNTVRFDNDREWLVDMSYKYCKYSCNVVHMCLNENTIKFSRQYST
jgi:hypothetical protein